jgi:hypothetical protein
MRAKVGDRLVFEATHVGEPRRIGIVTELHHADGTPPYTVRWVSDAHESLVFPGPDAHIETGEPTPAAG